MGSNNFGPSIKLEDLFYTTGCPKVPVNSNVVDFSAISGWIVISQSLFQMLIPEDSSLESSFFFYLDVDFG